MASFDGSVNDPRMIEMRRRHQRRMTRTFVLFATVEIVVLVAAAVLVYGFQVVDPEQGVWILVAIAAVGGFTLSGLILSMTQRHARELRDLGGQTRFEDAGA